MKKISVFALLILLLSCANNDDSTKNYKSEGIITAIDFTECLCCGGYIIEIENNGYHFFDEFPNKENLDLENLPIKVKLDWELISGTCDNFISISAIEPFN